LDTVHVTNAIGKKLNQVSSVSVTYKLYNTYAADTGTKHTEGEEQSEPKRRLFTGVVFGDEICSTWTN
jgi:hypothetical protein